MQYSVFECLLEPKQIEAMQKRIKKVIHPKKDQLRFYFLCAGCLKQVQVTSGKEVLHDDVAAIVVG